ncbi:MAG: hypothetical protein L3J16_00720, partial [Anaerolineales bacterium]|nr:hypothetical protein [Anaerolineales bacterium]
KGGCPMKKTLLIAPVLALILSACIPGILQQQQPAPEIPVDIQATVEVLANAKSAETMAALPTPTLAPATNTPVVEPTATETATPEPATETATPDGTEQTGTPTETPDGTVTQSVTPNPDDGTVTVTATGTLAITATPPFTLTPPEASPTSPISINPPPASVPRYKVTAINKSGVRIYISLQGVTDGGYYPIIEYDIARKQTVKFKAPKGFYTVIVWVGAEPMVDYVNINKDITLTIRKDSFNIDK